MFMELDESLNSNLSFGDESKVPMKMRDKILIRLKDRRHQLFQMFTMYTI